jgi:hypothetical protein
MEWAGEFDQTQRKRVITHTFTSNGGVFTLNATHNNAVIVISANTAITGCKVVFPSTLAEGTEITIVMGNWPAEQPENEYRVGFEYASGGYRDGTYYPPANASLMAWKQLCNCVALPGGLWAVQGKVYNYISGGGGESGEGGD